MDRIAWLYTLLNPIGRLAAVRAGLQRLLQKGDAESIKEACDFAQEFILQLENTIVEGGFLQETYRFDSTLVETMPAFTPEEESLGRSGDFADA
ncbi:hypothetical protein [Hyalangium versicolor]|uniref:hypothetical protein n=1 Tax=Hyalangium versicolor TaxID=2861190 RepID=UPI001CCA856A|nr:hypothetical protein [Hyalangium versicolor]